MSTIDDTKRKAALAAVSEVWIGAETGRPVVVGLGSGSTARIFVEELAKALDGRQLLGVPSSESTRVLAASLGLALLGDEGPWCVDVNVDGADEVSEALDLIKGGGAAHAREKIVNYAARRNIVIVDASKLSGRLGERWPVPIEVLKFAHGTTRAHLEALGRPELRVTRDGAPVETDAGNLIYDLRVEPIADPAALDAALHTIPGVVETGLFVGRADVVLVAGAGGVRRRVRRA